MRLDTPFLKLPIRFDAEALAAEIRAFPPSAWVPHPTGFVGNEAVRLVSVGGGANDDFRGAMAPTEYLKSSPYIMQIMAEIGGVWGRSRLMGLGAGGQVPRHIDTHHHWRTHWRIHVPAITNPAVKFKCGPETVHMAAGECWIFDSFRWHEVENGGTEQRVHLVLDTVGGPGFWDLVEAAKAGQTEARFLAPGERDASGLAFEQINSAELMSPWELRAHIAFLAGKSIPHPLLPAVLGRLDRFVDDWTVVWAQHGGEATGQPSYSGLVESLKRDLAALRGGDVLLQNKYPLYSAFDNMVLVHVQDQLAELQRQSSSQMPERLAS